MTNKTCIQSRSTALANEGVCGLRVWLVEIVDVLTQVKGTDF